METLDQQVDQLELRRNLVLSRVTILDSLMSKVLPDVDGLGTRTTTNDVVRTFYARLVVLKHHCIVPLLQSHVAQEVADPSQWPFPTRMPNNTPLPPRNQRGS